MARITLLFVLLSWLAACQTSTGVPHPVAVDQALLDDVSESARAEIDSARRARDSASDAVAVAERDFEAAKQRVALAKSDVEVARSKADRAREAVNLARKGTDQDLEQANHNLEQAQREFEAARGLVAVREKEVALARARMELEKERHELAEAQLELVKARAVEGIERPAADAVDVAAHAAAVREQETQVRLAEVKKDAAEREVQVATERHEQEFGAIKEEARDERR